MVTHPIRRRYLTGFAVIIVLGLSVLATPGLAAAFDDRAWRFSRVIRPSQGAGEGYVALSLDSNIVDKCRADLADLRVVSSTGLEAPCLKAEAGETDAPGPFPVKVFRISRQGDKCTDIWIDKTAKTITRGILIETSSRDFMRKVELRGSDNAREEYVIRMNGLILNSKGPPPISSLSVMHPLNGHQYIHVKILDQEEPPLKITGVRCYPPLPAKTQAPAINMTISENRVDRVRHSTELVAEMTDTTFPVHSIAIATSAKEFRKKVVISASNVLSSNEWEKVREDVLFKVQKELAVAEKLETTFPARALRCLKVELSGGTPEPVPVDGIVAKLTVRALVFRQAPGETYRLYYGNRDALPSPELPEAKAADLTGLLVGSPPVTVGEEIKVARPVEREPRQPTPPGKAPTSYRSLAGAALLIAGVLLLLLIGAMRKRSWSRGTPLRGSRLVRTKRSFRGRWR